MRAAHHEQNLLFALTHNSRHLKRLYNNIYKIITNLACSRLHCYALDRDHAAMYGAFLLRCRPLNICWHWLVHRNINQAARGPNSSWRRKEEIRLVVIMSKEHIR